MDNIITAAIGFVFGIISYLLTKKIDDIKSKIKQSLLGVCIVSELIEEIETSIKIMEEVNAMNIASGKRFPTASWSGMNSIPEEVLLTIVSVSKDVQAESFKITQCRTHCKNHFEHIAVTWNSYFSPDFNLLANQLYHINDMRFLEASQGVCKMLYQIKNLLKKNSNSWLPK